MWNEILTVIIGVGIINALIFIRTNRKANPFSGHLREMAIAAYLIITGLTAIYVDLTDSVVFKDRSALILLFLPAAMMMAKNELADRKRWLYGISMFGLGTVVAVYAIYQQSFFTLLKADPLSPSLFAALFLMINIFIFRGAHKLVLGLAALIWALNFAGLPATAVSGVNLLMGLIVLYMAIHDKSGSSSAFPFGLCQFIKAVPEPMLILDPSGKIVFANDSFVKISHYEANSIMQAEAVEFFDISPNWRFKSGHADSNRRIHCTLLSKTGKRVPVMLQFNEIYDFRQKLCSLLCIIHDERDRESLETRLKNESARFSSLYETSMALSSSLELKDVLKSIASAAENLIRADSCVIFSLDRMKQIIQPIFSSDAEYKAEIMNFQLAVGQGLTGTVVSDGKPRIQNFDEPSKMSVLVPGTADDEESLLSVPLMAKDVIIGALTLYKLGQRRFEEEDIKIITIFASQASAVIENSHLFMKLKASEKLYRFSVDLAGDAIFFVDPESGKISDSNEMCQKLFKYSKSDLASMHIWELQPEPQMHIAKRLWQEVTRIGWGKLGEIDYQAQNGLKIPASVNVSIIYTGEATSIQWIVRDLSEYKRALERAGFLQQIIECLGEPILLTDVKGRCLYGNESFCRTFDITKDQIAKGDILSMADSKPALMALKLCWLKKGAREHLIDEININPDNMKTKIIMILPFRQEQGVVKYYFWLFAPPLEVTRVAELEESLMG